MNQCAKCFEVMPEKNLPTHDCNPSEVVINYEWAVIEMFEGDEVTDEFFNCKDHALEELAERGEGWHIEQIKFTRRKSNSDLLSCDDVAGTRVNFKDI